MLIITRTEGLVEFDRGAGARLAIEVGRLEAAMLLAERQDGKVVHALVLATSDGRGPLRIEGQPEILHEMQAKLAEVMAELPLRHCSADDTDADADGEPAARFSRCSAW